MKHKITLRNDSPSEYFESNSEFKSVIIKKIKYSNSNDVSTLLCNWIHGHFGGIFSIPISEAYANQQDKFDIIKMSEEEKRNRILEDARAFYVAMTRSKKKLFFTSSTQAKNGKSVKESRFKECISPFFNKVNITNPS